MRLPPAALLPSMALAVKAQNAAHRRKIHSARLEDRRVLVHASDGMPSKTFFSRNEQNAFRPEWIIFHRHDQVRRPAREPASLIRCTLLAMPEVVTRKPWYTEVNRYSTTHAERRPLRSLSRCRQSRPIPPAFLLRRRRSCRASCPPMIVLV